MLVLTVHADGVNLKDSRSGGIGDGGVNCVLPRKSSWTRGTAQRGPHKAQRGGAATRLLGPSAKQTRRTLFFLRGFLCDLCAGFASLRETLFSCRHDDKSDDPHDTGECRRRDSIADILADFLPLTEDGSWTVIAFSAASVEEYALPRTLPG